MEITYNPEEEGMIAAGIAWEEYYKFKKKQ